VEPSPALAAELIAFCKERLAGFKCPRSVDFTDELPRHDNGKLTRRRSATRTGQRPERRFRRVESFDPSTWLVYSPSVRHPRKTARGWHPMLLRFDPFRDLDRLFERASGAPTSNVPPRQVPMDAYPRR
jgi:hypothetical protein